MRPSNRSWSEHPSPRRCCASSGAPARARTRTVGRDGADAGGGGGRRAKMGAPRRSRWNRLRHRWGRPSVWRSRRWPTLRDRALARHHRADAAGDRPARHAPVLLEDHRRHGGHRVRAGPHVHHGHRADLGKAVVGDLRRIGHGDHAEQPRGNPATPTTTTPTTDQSTTSATTTTTTAPPHHDLDDDHDHLARPSTTTTTGRERHDDDVDVARRERPGYQPLNSAGRRSTKLATPSLESSVFVSNSCPMASS